MKFSIGFDKLHGGQFK